MIDVTEDEFNSYIDALVGDYDCVPIAGSPSTNQYIQSGVVIAESSQGIDGLGRYFLIEPSP